MKTPKRFPTKDQMRAAKVFNCWELSQLGPDKLHVSFTPQEVGRMTRCAQYQVIRVGYKTDPKAHWLDYGNKTFSCYGTKDKDETRLAAIAWADGRYGTREWIRDPWGSWQDARVLPTIWELVRKMESEEKA